MNLTKIITSLIVGFCLMTLFNSCEKRLFDHRNKYVGDWTINYTTSSWMLGQPTTNSTGTYEAIIYYDKKDPETIHIELTSYYTLVLDIDREGNLSGCGIGGKFESKHSLNLTHSSSACTLAMGGGSNSVYTGTKN